MRDINSSSPVAARSQPSSPPSFTVGDNLRISVCCNQGGRKYMEDRVNIHCEFTADGQVDYIYVGVYDGHGGADASNFANQHLLQTIIKQPGFNSLQDADVLEAIRTGFLETHNAMRKVVDTWPRTASGFTSTSGTTSSVAFIRRGKLYIGHVGDSGIILGSQKPTGELVGSSLTVEHKPDSPEEKKRMEEIGGEVMSKSGVMRVVWVRPLRGHQGPVRRSTPKEKIPFLAVARALGDLWSYNSDLDAFVVSPEPDVSVLPLDSSHRCLIFGSDGLWNVLRPQHAVDIVNSHEWKEDEMNWMVNQNEGYETNHARWLVRHALMRWGNLRADNISVVTIIFGHRGFADSSYAKRVEQGGLSIEDILTTEPTSVIKVSPDRVNAVPTKPVELVYYGVSEVAPSERQSFFSSSQQRPGNNEATASASSSNYHLIPGYTSHERGPVFGSLLSSASASSSSMISRFGPTALYRNYSASVVHSTTSSQRAAHGEKENGSSSTSSISVSTMETKITKITTPRLPIDNIEEEASEAEEEPDSLSASNTTMDVDERNSATPKIEDNVSPDDQENGREAVGLFKFNSTACKLHGTVSCCSCSLMRAPLMQWSTSSDLTQKKQDYPIVAAIKEESVEPAPINVQIRRHTTNSFSSPLVATSSVDTYKCRRLARQRRSCPNSNSSTPHTYNTRQSCRTTRAGTKLSPQKSLFNRNSTIAPSSLEIGKQTRQFGTRSCSTNRRRSAVATATTTTAAAVVSSSLRSHRRRSSIIQQQQRNQELTPRRVAASATTPTTSVRRIRKNANFGDKMRLRSAKTPNLLSPTKILAFEASIKKRLETKLSNSLTEERVDVDDDNVENLGAQFLESLNLETPNLESGRKKEKMRMSLDEMITGTTTNLFQGRSPGARTRKSENAKLNRSKNLAEERRRASLLVSLKRKLYFDDQALIEQRTTDGATTSTTTANAFSKRIKGLRLSFLKRST